MWLYEKRLQYPVNVRKPDAKTAKIVISQLGGPNGELGAALRYLSQRYTMPYPRIQALLTDIGSEAPKMFLLGANAFFDAFATV